jgi:hypothetical protein
MASWNKQDFESLLKETYKLAPTSEGVPSARAWKCPGGQHVLVPNLKDSEMYDSAILSRIERALNSVNQNPLTQAMKAKAPAKAPKKKK